MSPRKDLRFVCSLSVLLCSWSSPSFATETPTAEVLPPPVPETAPLEVPPPIVTADLPPIAPSAKSPTPPTPEQPVVPPAPEAKSEPVPPPPAPVAEEKQQPVEAPIAQTTRTEIDLPRGTDYQQIQPRWATQLSYSPNALGKTDVSGKFGTTNKGATLTFQYQPRFLQAIGVVSFGPTVSVYPMFPQRSDVTNSVSSIWSYGGVVRYQGRYFHEQILVPVVGLNYERFSYSVNTIGRGNFNLTGPVVGLNLLLNPFEPSSAFDLYSSTGVLRSYLTAEAVMLKGNDAQLRISGTSLFFGLRVEF